MYVSYSLLSNCQEPITVVLTAGSTNSALTLGKPAGQMLVGLLWLLVCLENISMQDWAVDIESTVQQLTCTTGAALSRWARCWQPDAEVNAVRATVLWHVCMP